MLMRRRKMPDLELGSEEKRTMRHSCVIMQMNRAVNSFPAIKIRTREKKKSTASRRKTLKWHRRCGLA